MIEFVSIPRETAEKLFELLKEKQLKIHSNDHDERRTLDRHEYILFDILQKRS